MNAQARLAVETPHTTRSLADFVSFALLLLKLCTMQWFSTMSARSVAPQRVCCILFDAVSAAKLQC